MTVPASKADLLAAITGTFDKLMADLSNVPVDRARERTLDGHAAGTKMSPADLVSYLVGWNELVLKGLDQDDSGTKVDFARRRVPVEPARPAGPEVLSGIRDTRLLAVAGPPDNCEGPPCRDRFLSVRRRALLHHLEREMDKGADDSVSTPHRPMQMRLVEFGVAQDASFGCLTLSRWHRRISSC